MDMMDKEMKFKTDTENEASCSSGAPQVERDVCDEIGQVEDLISNETDPVLAANMHLVNGVYLYFTRRRDTHAN